MDEPRYIVRGLLERRDSVEILDGALIRQGEIERRVVIKRVRESHDESTTRTFFDEAQVLRQIEHPNVVHLIDVGIVDGQAFQVLEFIPGLDASKVIERCVEVGERLPSVIALHITAEIARALEHVHGIEGLGLVHRDVTPSNILLAWDGRVLLTDFGIAMFRDRAAETQVGFVKGKLGYMSPEQMLRSNLDGRADVFSLGCVLHALCTGTTPLATEEARQKILLGEAPEFASDLDASIRAILVKALAPDRRHRFRSAREFAEACSAAVAGEASQTSMAEWLLGLISASDAPGTDRTRVETQPEAVGSFIGLTFGTQTGTRREFMSGATDGQTMSRVVEFFEETTASEETSSKTETHGVTRGERASSAPAARTPPGLHSGSGSSLTPSDSRGLRAGTRSLSVRLISPHSWWLGVMLVAAGAIVLIASWLARDRPPARVPSPAETAPPAIVAVPGVVAKPTVIPAPAESAVESTATSSTRASAPPPATKSRRSSRKRRRTRRPRARTEVPGAAAGSDVVVPKSANLDDGFRRLVGEMKRAQAEGVPSTRLRVFEKSYLDLTTEARTAQTAAQKSAIRRELERLRKRVARARRELVDERDD